MRAKAPDSILFVCLGNICRSPLAEGVFRAVLDAEGVGTGVRLDSAGTGAWHLGSPPDPRSVAIAARNGIDISGQRARRPEASDFRRFDLIFGMDRSNVEDIRRIAPPGTADRVHLFLEYAGMPGREVSDPYFDGSEGFADAYRTIREASKAIVSKFEWRSEPPSGQASSTM